VMRREKGVKRRDWFWTKDIFANVVDFEEEYKEVKEVIRLEEKRVWKDGKDIDRDVGVEGGGGVEVIRDWRERMEVIVWVEVKSMKKGEIVRCFVGI
jgi:hypothetical protein